MRTNFQEDLKRGQAGELIISKHLGLIRLGGKGADLRCGKTGLLYEVKSDFYSPWQSPNFFMEHTSVDTSGALGGPYRAAQKGIDMFVYYFIKAGLAYEFRTEELVAALESKDWGRPVSVLNASYRTLGHKVNRAELLGMVKHARLILLEETV